MHPRERLLWSEMVISRGKKFAPARRGMRGNKLGIRVFTHAVQASRTGYRGEQCRRFMTSKADPHVAIVCTCQGTCQGYVVTVKGRRRRLYNRRLYIRGGCITPTERQWTNSHWYGRVRHPGMRGMKCGCPSVAVQHLTNPPGDRIRPANVSCA